MVDSAAPVAALTRLRRLTRARAGSLDQDIAFITPYLFSALATGGTYSTLLPFAVHFCQAIFFLCSTQRVYNSLQKALLYI